MPTARPMCAIDACRTMHVMSAYTLTLPRRRHRWPALRGAQLAFLLPLGAIQLAAVAALASTGDDPGRVEQIVAALTAGLGAAGIWVAIVLPRRTFLVRDAAWMLLRAEVLVCLVQVVGCGWLTWLALVPVLGVTSLLLRLDERLHPSFV